MFSKIYDDVHFAFKNKHEDGCRQKVQAQGPWWYMKIQVFKVIVRENKAFMHVAKKGDAFLIYVFPTLDVR
jgi:hypothetical protein